MACASTSAPQRTPAARANPPAPTESREKEAGSGSAVASEAEQQTLAPTTFRVEREPGVLDEARLSVSYGTDQPGRLVAADPEQRWMVVCQARHDTDGNGVLAAGFGRHGWPAGDEMRPYFVVGGGAGVPIDEYLGSDPSGRYVALRYGTEIVLEDVQTGKRTRLSTDQLDTRGDPSAAMPTRQLSFGAQGEHLLLLGRARGGSARVLLRQLSTGRTRTLNAGRGLVWRASLSLREKWAELVVVTRDTNKNGKLDLPVVGTNLSGAVCRGSGSFSTYGVQDGHDAYETRYLHLATGKVVSGDRVVLSYGDELLRRTKDGRIEAVSSSGRARFALPEHCQGRVMAANSSRDAVLVACSPEPSRRAGVEAWLFRSGVGSQLGYGAGGSNDARQELLDDFYVRSDFDVFDLAVGVRLRLPANTRFCAAGKNHLLLQSPEGETLLWEPATDITHRVSHERCHSSDLKRGDFVLIGADLFDWEQLRVVGRFPSHADGYRFGERYARGLSGLGQLVLDPPYDLEQRLPSTKPAPKGTFHWVVPVPVKKSEGQ